MKSDGKRCLFVSFSFEGYRKFLIVFWQNIDTQLRIIAFYKFTAG